jgi:hypothetical protein
MGIMVTAYVIASQSLLFMNRAAALSRLRTNARIVVERYILQALSVPYTGTSAPGILGITPAGGAVIDDDGGADGLTNIMTQDSTGPVLVKGTLVKFVTGIANTYSADIRRVTFRMNYDYAGKNYTYEITTIRAKG